MHALHRCIHEIWCLYIAVLHMALPLSLCVRSSVTAACRCSIGFYRAMLCIRGASHGPVSVCLSVTSRSSTKTAERIGLVFGVLASFHPSYTVLKGNSVISKITALPSGTLS